jgi:hypothetical protein
VAEIARKERIKDGMLYEWCAAFLRNAPQAFTAPAPEREHEERVAELEQVIGRLTVENEVLKKSVALAEWDVEAKRQLARKLAPRYGIKRVCDVLGLAHSSYHYETRQRSDAVAFAAELRKQAGKHPTEGYRHLAGRMRRIARWSQTSPGRVQRWMRKLGLSRKKRRKPRRTTNSQHSYKRYKNLVKRLRSAGQTTCGSATSPGSRWPTETRCIWRL